MKQNPIAYDQKAKDYTPKTNKRMGEEIKSFKPAPAVDNYKAGLFYTPVLNVFRTPKYSHQYYPTVKTIRQNVIPNDFKRKNIAFQPYAQVS